MSSGLKMSCLAAMLGVAALAMPVSAQPGGGNPGGGRGGRGMQGVTTALTNAGATADEITKLTPLIQAVQTAQQATQVRQFGMGGGRGNAGGGNPPPAPTTEVGKAAADLQTTIDNKDAKPDEIKDKLKALRDAKAKAMEDLKKAQKALTEVLSQKEEAVLVEQGILE